MEKNNLIIAINTGSSRIFQFKLQFHHWMNTIGQFFSKL